jgi:GNAT superfamily N-acetyltransferase
MAGSSRMKHLLDNITWHTLTGPHAKFAAGTGAARRYAVGFSPILGFADPERPDFEPLDACSAPGEQFYTDGWSGSVPAGWRMEAETTMFKMVWDGPLPDYDSAPDAVSLELKHSVQAVELATLTRPGPFGPRTIELGEYFGYFEDGQLVAMAGERMCAADLHEISGVCTHPNRQGRGFARRLMLKLVLRQMLRGKTPFLHVMRDNAGARALYERMGFKNYKESVVRVIARN